MKNYLCQLTFVLFVYPWLLNSVLYAVDHLAAGKDIRGPWAAGAFDSYNEGNSHRAANMMKALWKYKL